VGKLTKPACRQAGSPGQRKAARFLYQDSHGAPTQISTQKHLRVERGWFGQFQNKKKKKRSFNSEETGLACM